MKTWFRWVILVVTIGGGFQGFAEIFAEFLALQSKTPAAVVLCGIITVFYILAIVAGLRFAENPKYTSVLIIVLLTQIPVIYSPILGYELNTALLVVLKFVGCKPGLGYLLGSDHRLLIGYDMPWGIGVNVVPVALLTLFHRFAFADRRSPGN